MVWQKIDDQFGVHKKVIRIPRKKRLEALGLWLLVLNYSGRQGTDGVVEEHELDECLGKPVVIDELVRVELWHGTGHACASCVQPPAGGVVIHDFLEYNPDAASTSGERESKSEGGRHGNHVRWHEQRGVIAEGCEWCHTRSDQRSGSDTGSGRIAIAEGSLRNPPGPVPGPDPLTDVTYPPASTPEVDARATLISRDLVSILDERAISQAAEVGINKLSETRTVLEHTVTQELTLMQTLEVCLGILAKATERVGNPPAYIATTCRDTPATVFDVLEMVQNGAVA